MFRSDRISCLRLTVGLALLTCLVCLASPAHAEHRERYEDALANARMALAEHRFDEADTHFDQAYESAWLAVRDLEFGATKTKLPLNIRTGEMVEIPLPEGLDIPKNVAREAAIGFARASQVEFALSHAHKPSTIYEVPERVDLLRPDTLDRINKLVDIAQSMDDDAAVRFYTVPLTRHKLAVAQREEEFQRRRANARKIWAFVFLLGVAGLVLLTWKIVSSLRREDAISRPEPVEHKRRVYTFRPDLPRRHFDWDRAPSMVGGIVVSVTFIGLSGVLLNLAWEKPLDSPWFLVIVTWCLLGFVALAIGWILAPINAAGPRLVHDVCRGSFVPIDALLESFDIGRNQILANYPVETFAESDLKELYGGERVVAALTLWYSRRSPPRPDFDEIILNATTDEDDPAWDAEIERYMGLLDGERRLMFSESLVASRQERFSPTAAGSVHVEGLRVALKNGREWPYQTWFDRYVESPLNALTQRVIWQSGDQTFRVESDGTLVSADHETVVISRGPVHVMHPGAHPRSLWVAWNEHFADYELQSPIEQLEREPIRAHGSALVIPISEATSGLFFDFESVHDTFGLEIVVEESAHVITLRFRENWFPVNASSETFLPLVEIPPVALSEIHHETLNLLRNAI